MADDCPVCAEIGGPHGVDVDAVHQLAAADLEAAGYVVVVDQVVVERRAAVERRQTVEVTCARPGCGHGYSEHSRADCRHHIFVGSDPDDRCGCAGFQWVDPAGSWWDQ